MQKSSNLLNKRRKSFRKSNDAFLSFKYAWNGFQYCIKNERNFKIQFIFGILSLILSYLLNLNPFENIILFATIFSVLILELLNTAIEKLVDLIVDDNFNRLAKIAKDCSAASVLLAAINSLFVAVYLFFPKIKLLIDNF